MREVTVLKGVDVWIAYTNTLLRAGGLMCGALIAIAPEVVGRYAKLLIVAGLSLICAAIIQGHSLDHYALPFSGYGLGGGDLAFMGIVSLVVTQPGKAFLWDMPQLRFIGKVSYGIYIIHYPLLLTFARLGLDAYISRYLTASLAWIIYMLFVTGLCVLLAALSYRFYETPFLNLRKRWV